MTPQPTSAPPLGVRFYVAHDENGRPILVNTETGQTWRLRVDASLISNDPLWAPIERYDDAAGRAELVERFGEREYVLDHPRQPVKRT